MFQGFSVNVCISGWLYLFLLLLFFIDYVSSVDLFFSRVHWSVQGHAKRM